MPQTALDRAQAFLDKLSQPKTYSDSLNQIADTLNVEGEQNPEVATQNAQSSMGGLFDQMKAIGAFVGAYAINKNKPYLESVVNPIKQGVEQTVQGIKQVPDNPVAGVLNTATGIANTGFGVAMTPFNLGMETGRQAGLEKPVQIAEKLMSLPAEGYKKASDFIANKTNAIENSSKLLGVDKNTMQEIYDAQTGLGEIVSTLMSFGALHKGGSALKSKLKGKTTPEVQQILVDEAKNFSKNENWQNKVANVEANLPKEFKGFPIDDPYADAFGKPDQTVKVSADPKSRLVVNTLEKQVNEAIKKSEPFDEKQITNQINNIKDPKESQRLGDLYNKVLAHNKNYYDKYAFKGFPIEDNYSDLSIKGKITKQPQKVVSEQVVSKEAIKEDVKSQETLEKNIDRRQDVRKDTPIEKKAKNIGVAERPSPKVPKPRAKEKEVKEPTKEVAKEPKPQNEITPQEAQQIASNPKADIPKVEKPSIKIDKDYFHTEGNAIQSESAKLYMQKKKNEITSEQYNIEKAKLNERTNKLNEQRKQFEEQSKVKQPYEMTLDEYTKDYVEKAWSQEMGKPMKYNDIDPSLRSMAGNNAWDNHYEIVSNAIQEGKTVPKEVLKDYPDLQKGVKNVIQEKVQGQEKVNEAQIFINQLKKRGDKESVNLAEKLTNNKISLAKAREESLKIAEQKIAELAKAKREGEIKRAIEKRNKPITDFDNSIKEQSDIAKNELIYDYEASTFFDKTNESTNLTLLEGKGSLRNLESINKPNKLWTKEVDQAYKNIKEKSLGRSNMFGDPTIIKDYAIVGFDYIKQGAKSFTEWSKKMIEIFSEKIKPHLLKIWDSIKKEFGKQLLELDRKNPFSFNKQIMQGKIWDTSVDASNVKELRKSQQEGIATKTKGKDKKVVSVIRDSGFYAPEELATAPIKDVKNITAPPHLMALSQDNTKLGKGFGAVYTKVWLPIKENIAIKDKFIGDKAKEFNKIVDKYKFKKSAKNGDYLSDLMEGKVDIPDRYKPMIQDLRDFFDNLRLDVNEIRTRMGKDAIEYIKDYVPHIRKTSVWNELMGDVGRIENNFDFIIPNESKNPHAYKRLLKELPNSERNFFNLADKYINASAKDVYLNPSIEHLKASIEVFKDRELYNVADYWQRYIREGLLGKQSIIDSKLNVSANSKSNLKKYKTMLNHAYLTGKFAWNIATQPLSYIANTPMEAGFLPAIKAPFKVLTQKGLLDYVRKESLSLQIKSGDVLSLAVGEGKSTSNRIYKTPIEKWNDAISKFGAIEEQMLHELSFIAGLERAKKLGYKGEDIPRFADLVAERTQSMYNKENRALILNSDIITSTFPFQSFAVEMFNHVKEIGTKNGAMQLTYGQRFGKLFRLATGVYLANMYSKAITGNEKTTIGSFIPFFGYYLDQVLGVQLNKTVNKLVTGDVEGVVEDFKKSVGKTQSGRIPVSYVDQANTILKGAKDYLEYGNAKRLRQFGINFGTSFFGIGGGGQINNLIDGIMADIDEEVKNVKGNTLFKVKTAKDKIKAPIWGVWSTSEGRKYWEQREDGVSSTTSGTTRRTPRQTTRRTSRRTSR